MINLLIETKLKLSRHGLTLGDIKKICIINRSTFEIESEISGDPSEILDFQYKKGEVENRLALVGSDWWLQRWENDTSEGWSFKKFPWKRGGV